MCSTMIISGLGERETGRGDSNSTVRGEAGLETMWAGEVEVLDPMSIRTWDVRVPVHKPDFERTGEGRTGLTALPRGLIGGNLGDTRGVPRRAGDTNGCAG